GLGKTTEPTARIWLSYTLALGMGIRHPALRFWQPMPIHSIEPRRLYRQIADQIRALIRSREFAVGSRLPPERDLARQLGVSRPSVREALIALEVEGLVEVRIGSGIYVLNGSRAVSRAKEIQAASGPFELLRARWLIEGECAALAGTRFNRRNRP